MEKLIVLQLTESDLRQIIREEIREAVLVLEEKRQNDQPDGPDIIDANEAAKFLKIALSTIYGKTSKSMIPHFKRGRKLYFKKSELIAWIEAGKQKTQKDIEQLAEEYLRRSKNRH